MKELLKDLSLEEMESLKGGTTAGTFVQVPIGDGSGGKPGGYNAAQCAYFLSLCLSGAGDTYGCGSTKFNCDLYKSGC